MSETLTKALALYEPLGVYVRAHKALSTIAIIVIVAGGYYTYTKVTAPSTAPRYVLATAATGSVIATLTESGQVSASHELALSPKASGEVIGLYVKPGDAVSAGQVVAALDASDATQALRDAELAYQTAELTYQQNIATATPLEMLQAKNAVTNAGVSLDKAHDAAYAALATVYSDLGAIMTGLDTTIHGATFPGRTYEENLSAYADTVYPHDSSIALYQNSTATSYTAAVTAYQNGLAAYKTTSRALSNDDLLALAQTTYQTTQVIADAVKNTHDFYDRVSTDYTLYNLGTPPGLSTLLTSTLTYTTTVNNDLSSALSSKTNIVSAEQALAEAEDALTKSIQGPDDLALKSAALTLARAEQSVTSAQNTVEDYVVRAPFAGTIASVGVMKYDQAGSGTTVATLVTDKQQATISVNEVDAAKLAVGQKATLVFDALPGISIAGTVTSVNTIGTVAQGVVSYGATVTFDTSNPEIKPGMSVDASIVTSAKDGVLVVPTSAVKSNANGSYVQVFSPALSTTGVAANQGIQTTLTPTNVPVTTGLSSDTAIEILSGISAGTQVVVRTITGTATAVTTSASSGSATRGGTSLGGIRIPTP